VGRGIDEQVFVSRTSAQRRLQIDSETARERQGEREERLRER